MALYRVTVMRDDEPVGEEQLRAAFPDQALSQFQLRFVRCRPGETIVLTQQGVELKRLGPRGER